MLFVAPLLLFACNGEPEDSEPPLDDTVIPLEQPDLTGVDLEAAYESALRLALEVTVQPAWAGHRGALDLARSGCPDVFAGAPDDDGADIDEDAEGVSWADHCSTAGGLSYSGFAWWDTDLSSTGEPGSAEGVTIEGSRELVADGVVADSDGVIFEFDGEGSDALYQVEAEGYSRWTYASLLSATVTGREVVSATTGAAPGGWRSDLYVYATGGDTDTLAVRGNAYYFSPVIQDRFDSVYVALSWAAPDDLAPDDCALEPRGFLSVRDEDAFWYDLVFMPGEGDDISGDQYPNDPYAVCDGCGTLYVRGLSQELTVCPDFSWLWDGAVSLPAAEDFVLTLRDLESP